MIPPSVPPSHHLHRDRRKQPLSLIDAERYFYDLRNVGFPMPDGCSAHGMMDVDEVDEE